MPATSLEILGTVRPDGSLVLDEKLSVPPSRVKVRVESVEAPAKSVHGLVEFVQHLRQVLAASGHIFRTKEEIDAEIDELRKDWN